MGFVNIRWLEVDSINNICYFIINHLIITDVEDKINYELRHIEKSTPFINDLI